MDQRTKFKKPNYKTLRRIMRNLHALRFDSGFLDKTTKEKNINSRLFLPDDQVQIIDSLWF